jgi:methionine-rich copper-binding protein CopC
MGDRPSSFILFGLGISGVAAHSRLVKSDPPARAVLATVPKELRLWFNEAVEPAFQVTELWFKLVLFELRAARERIRADDPSPLYPKAR